MKRRDSQARSSTTVVTRWIGRIGVFAGGWLLLSRLVPVPAGPQPGAQPDATVISDPTGRGKPAEPPSASARAAGHETRDMDARTMAKLVAGLFVVAAIIIGGMVLVNRLLHRLSVAEQPHFTAEQTAPIEPPAPNLQADAPGDLNRVRGREDALLDNYAWVDPGHTRARIPIKRAMALIVGHKLDNAP